jgi:hypothetical protein
MVTPPEDLIAWLARHEINVSDVATISDLQRLLLSQKLEVNPGFQAALFNMATYENRVFTEFGIRPVYVTTNLYNRLGFGVKGQAGFYSWDSLKRMFGLEGPRPA